MSGAKTITLQIEGMDCASCANTITQTIIKSGPQDVHVDFVTGEAVFEEVPQQQLKEIIKSIQQIGYKVVGEGPRKLHESHHHAAPISWKLLISAIFTVPLLLHMFLDVALFADPWFQLILSIPVMVIGLTHFGKSAWGSVRVGIPNMDVLIFVGAFSAFAYSILGAFILHPGHHAHEYLFFETGATIITLVLTGNWIEHISVKKTAGALEELYRLQDTQARKIVNVDGKESLLEVNSATLIPGDECRVNTGDTIPADGVIMEGGGITDESMITGESTPVNKEIGKSVFKGTILTSGSARIRVEKKAEETVLGKIIEMVKEATRSKPQIQQLGDKVSAIFVPVVLLIAAGTLMVWKFTIGSTWSESLMPALAVLVISCPCAMGLATPTAVMVGLGRAAKKGILIRGGRTLEEMASVTEILFDKTGTLTTGKLRWESSGVIGNADEQKCLSIIYQLEMFSSHPIARSVMAELQHRVKPILLTGVKENKGYGMEGKLEDGTTAMLGSVRTLPPGIEHPDGDLFLSLDGKPVYFIKLGDDWRSDAGDTIRELNTMGVKTTLVSGDREEKCRKAKEFGVTEIYAGQLPDQKLEIVRSKKQTHPVAMVGDGINDAPALAAATVGVSLGSGTQIAIRSAGIILSGSGDLSKLSEAYLISRHTLLTIKQNLFWAFAYNVVAIPLAAMGMLNPMIGALSMAFSDLVVIGNSLRLRNKKLR